MHRQARQDTTTHPSGIGPVAPNPTPAGRPLFSSPLPLSIPTDAVTSSGTTDVATEATPFAPASTPTPTPISFTTAIPTPVMTPIGSAADPAFAFLPLENATTCGVCTIRWTVTSPRLADLAGAAIDLDVAGIGNDASTSTPIASSLPVLIANFTWSPVNVRPGQYEIHGRWSDKHGAAVQSAVFDVNSVGAAACLANATGTSSAAAAATHKSANKAAVVVGVLGGIVLLVCLAVAFVCLRRRVSRRRPGGRGRSGGWDTLDNKAPGGGGPRGVDGNNHSASASGNVHPLLRTHGAALASKASLDSLKKDSFPHPATLEYDAPWAATAAATTAAPHAAADDELAGIPGRRRLPVLESSSPRGFLELSPSTGGGGGGGDLSRAPSPPTAFARRPARKPVPAYTPTPEELESLARARSRSGRGTTALETMKTPTSSSSPSPASPGVPLLSSWSATSSPPPLRSKMGGLFEGVGQGVHYLVPDSPPPLPEPCEP